MIRDFVAGFVDGVRRADARVRELPVGVFVLVMMATIAACPSSPPTATSQNPPAPPPDDCGVACARLSLLGCAEGANAHCVGVCQHVVDAGLTALDPGCISMATTKAEARACGVACKE